MNSGRVLTGDQRDTLPKPQFQFPPRHSVDRAIGVTTDTRSAALPEIPAIGEFVSGYETSAWWGLCAPNTTPAAIVERLSNETNAALADPALKARLAALGADPMVMGPAEFSKLIADETEKWAKVIKFAGIKVE
jgi:tripartite-type tricarboxylate transporter receptor subunit TctC